MNEVVEVTGDEEADYKLRLLIDTCVWLEIAKDYSRRPSIGAVEELVRADVIGLIVPGQINVESGRNIERIIQESRRRYLDRAVPHSASAESSDSSDIRKNYWKAFW
jgi:hypothetical protein